MTTAVQHRRGTTAEHSTFTGLEGEVTIDTTKDTAVIHDGVLAGGYPLAKETLANVNPTALTAITGAATASDDLFMVYDASTTAMKKITRAELNNAMEADALANVSITGGTINGTTIGGTTPAAGSFTTGQFGTSLNVDGTATMDGLTVSGSVGSISIGSTGNILDFDRAGANYIRATDAAGLFQINAGGKASMRLDANGDISFYEDTGTTPKFFWDASAENLGIGTSSPSEKLTVNGRIRSFNSTTGVTIDTVTTALEVAYLPDNWGTSQRWRVYSGGGTATDLTFSKDGNLGLGVTPSAWGTGLRTIDIGAGASLTNANSTSDTWLSTNAYYTTQWLYKNSGVLATYYAQTNGTHRWYTAPSGTAGNAISFTQAMTLDASGRLLVGTTAASVGAKLEIADSADSAFTATLWGADKTTEYFAFGVAGTGESRITAGGAGTSSNAITFYTSASGTEAERLRIDSSGNLGLGVTPSASGSTYGGAQMRTLTVQSANIVSAAGYDAHFAQNAYRLTDGTWRYQGNGGDNVAHLYSQATGGSHIWYTAPSGTAGNAISFTQAMTLGSNGKLLVGTTIDNGGYIQTPQASIGTAGVTGTYGLQFWPNTAGGSVYLISNDGTGALTFSSGGAFSSGSNVTRMRLDSSGNLLVGTTSTPGGIISCLVPNSGTGLGVRVTTNGNWGAAWYNASSTYVGYIAVGATSTTYATSSDYRLKENIQPMTGALDTVAQLKPCTYTWKADGSDGEGFIAHELAEVCPHAVTGEKDAVDADGNPVYQGIDTSFLVATLTAAIQEQQAIIEDLKSRLTAAGL